MSSTFNQVVEDARKAWLSNYTIADARWRLRQLHGLHQLVLKNRETLINALAEGDHTPIMKGMRRLFTHVLQQSREYRQYSMRKKSQYLSRNSKATSQESIKMPQPNSFAPPYGEM